MKSTVFKLNNIVGKARAFSNALALLGTCMQGVKRMRGGMPAVQRPLMVGLMLHELKVETRVVLAGFFTHPLEIGVTTVEEVNERVWNHAGFDGWMCCLDPVKDSGAEEEALFNRGMLNSIVQQVVAAYAVFDLNHPPSGEDSFHYRKEIRTHAMKWYNMISDPDRLGTFHPVTVKLHQALVENLR